MIVPDCIASRRVGGIIVVGKIADENLRPLLSLPLVIVDHAPRTLRLNCVRTDNISGGFMAALTSSTGALAGSVFSGTPPTPSPCGSGTTVSWRPCTSGAWRT